ncbi:hypothetical protein L211DRAFT_303178 [Terfezia boudieri ATCC MYA-4762]|uniref:Uncharacterized protein n=1 Tax=Terfezia boudieri ATCC MYA-4762 TaxID=1051890 RepID=A0A3N4LQ96_9PEZI|nr:hypothetical protein L211DRAFT_303178 [Terfezia boudieri ATCC MYA-4762]
MFWSFFSLGRLFPFCCIPFTFGFFCCCETVTTTYYFLCLQRWAGAIEAFIESGLLWSSWEV